ncbi:hypothetical protein SGRA_2791 [Saprospira grandis str. Lewin]|uniref:Uncharacterized protein n=1 Tax=Saprospira grandis (strain Lewin) TaxID=984262 RepID=H6LA51_SAPGL|nr:hypothetical protein SGRA_2791 [Saprospira grandis str. Lewin]
MAQRCGAGGRRPDRAFFEQSEKKAKGRADLRAPQHSGGRARRSLVGRGPQKNKQLAIEMTNCLSKTSA